MQQPESAIIELLQASIRGKILSYKPKNNYMPFHSNLLGKDRMKLYRFIHSLNYSFNTIFFEPVAIKLAEGRFLEVSKQVNTYEYITVKALGVVNDIMDNLSIAKLVPNKIAEIEKIREVAQLGERIKVKQKKIGIKLVSHDGEVYLFDLKRAKPNIAEFKDYKRTLLEWVATELFKDSSTQIQTAIAIPYNPYFPEPYKRWTIRGMIDLKYEFKVAEEFWDCACILFNKCICFTHKEIIVLKNIFRTLQKSSRKAMGLLVTPAVINNLRFLRLH